MQLELSFETRESKETNKIQQIVEKYFELKKLFKGYYHGQLETELRKHPGFTTEEIDLAMDQITQELKEKHAAKEAKKVAKLRAKTAQAVHSNSSGGLYPNVKLPKNPVSTWIDGYYGNKDDDR